ncbi:hypothetical protein [Ascidiimonas aurantiaca]|uniref:hypothetical protein n=1 Tax=Ascidiimonas aurantiaca TaxID=1685432 RepID=UPI0030EE669C
MCCLKPFFFRYASSLLLLWGGLSCSQPPVFETEQALNEYLAQEENGYRHHKNINGVTFTLTYRPTDLLVAQDAGTGLSLSQLDSLRSHYGNYLYFNLSVSKNNEEILTGFAGNRARFGAMVNQLSFGMAQSIHFYTPARDTIAMLDYIYPRMYGMSKSTTLLMVYPKEPRIIEKEYMFITIEDLGLKTGEVTFKVPMEPIRKQPELQFKTQ